MSNVLVMLMLTIFDTRTGELSARQQSMTLVQCNADMNAAKASASKTERVFGGCFPITGRSFQGSK